MLDRSLLKSSTHRVASSAVPQNHGAAWRKKSAPNPSSSFATMPCPARKSRGFVCAVFILAANLLIFGVWLTDPTALVSTASNIFTLGTPDTRKLANVEGSDVERYETKSAEFQQGLGAPKVALMFLTVGNMPHEPTWRAFLEAAGKLELEPKSSAMLAPVKQPKELVGQLKPPIEPYEKREDYGSYALQDAGGYHRGLLSEGEGLQGPTEQENPLGWESPTEEENPEILLRNEVERLMEGRENGEEIIRAQSLFSIYVNAPPGFEYPSNSLFHGAIIPTPVNVTNGYGQWVPVEAQLEMMKEALKDPRNEKFVLVSESCIPIHSPEIVYAQLIGITRSVVNACKEGDTMAHKRWTKLLKTEHFKWTDWRKSGQWNALTREHSLLVVEDQHVKEMFKRHCFRSKDPPQHCTPSEHYIPSLLGSYGLANQTTCKAPLTYTEWPHANTSTHPRTFKASIVNAKLIRSMYGEKCDPAEALASVHCLFKRKPGFEKHNSNFAICYPTEYEEPTWVTDSGYLLLPRCPLFARKFKEDSVRQVLEAVLSCDGVGLGHWC